MSAKPSEVPTFATDANYPAGAETYSGTPTKVAPGVTRRARGWEPKKKPPAQVENYDRNLIGQWCQYLNDGNLQGNYSFDSDTVFDGLLTSNNDGGLVSFDTGIITPTTYWTTAVQQPYAPADWYDDGTHTFAYNQITVGAAANPIFLPLRVNVGDRITAFKVRVNKLSNASNSISAKIVATADGTDADQSSAVTNSANAPGYINLTSGTLAIDVVANAAYFIRFQSNGSGNFVYQAEISVTHPAP